MLAGSVPGAVDIGICGGTDDEVDGDGMPDIDGAVLLESMGVNEDEVSPVRLEVTGADMLDAVGEVDGVDSDDRSVGGDIEVAGGVMEDTGGVIGTIVGAVLTGGVASRFSHAARLNRTQIQTVTNDRTRMTISRIR